MSRLLSEEQIKQIRLLPENENNTYSEMITTIAKVQLYQTDEEWVEWLKEHIIVSPDALFKDCIIIHPSEFKERIREIGL
jgi:hypothetical protein